MKSPPFEGTLVKDANRNLNLCSKMLTNLHTSINQISECNYLASCFLEKEKKVVTELYGIVNELFFLLQVPLRWDFHREIYKRFVQIKKAEQGLDKGFVY